MGQTDHRFLSAAEAAAALGVTRPTLYAYTSRGQMRSEAIPGRPRERRYYREDVERLRERKETRRDPARAAARGLHWGGPALESSITLIHDGRFYYRGRDVMTLAKAETLEQIAARLWDTPDAAAERIFRQPSPLPVRQLVTLRALTRDPLAAMQAALPVAGAIDVASFDLSPATVRRTGARIMRLFTGLVGGRDANLPVHRALQVKWAPKEEAVADALRTTLVLCADHELNVSAFTARCAASAGASPYQVVAAALATFRGYKHGGASERVLTLLDEIDTPRAARTLVGARLKHGESLPGFGHRLYVHGDPRAVELLRLAEAAGREHEWRKIRQLWRVGSELLDDAPNLDFGLAAVTRVYRLPPEAPALLFALARTVGWIAHAMEEYASGELIRPRARYVGPMPATAATNDVGSKNLARGGLTMASSSARSERTGPHGPSGRARDGG